MTQQYSPSGGTITREDGSNGHAVKYRDADGEMCGKAFIPSGETVEVPDYVDIEKSEIISWSELSNAIIHSEYKTETH